MSILIQTLSHHEPTSCGFHVEDQDPIVHIGLLDIPLEEFCTLSTHLMNSLFIFDEKNVPHCAIAIRNVLALYVNKELSNQRDQRIRVSYMLDIQTLNLGKIRKCGFRIGDIKPIVHIGKYIMHLKEYCILSRYLLTATDWFEKRKIPGCINELKQVFKKTNNPDNCYQML